MIAVVGLLAAGLARAGVVDRVAAVVGDDVVALSEVYDTGAEYIADRCPSTRDACVRAAELEILDQLILRALVRQELVDLQLDVTREDLDLTLEGIASDNGMDLPTLRREIERSGTPWEVYRDEIREQLRQLRFQKWVIEPRIPVTEDELVDLYRRRARELSGPDRVRFHAITQPLPADGDPVDAVTGFLEVREALLRGDLTWEEAVAAHHSGQITGESGDRLPPVEQGDLAAPLDTVVFGTPVGGISQPVVANGFVFLVRPVERITPDVLPFEEVRDRLTEAVKAQKAEQEIEQWYLQARRRAAVRILLEPIAS